MSTQEFLLFDFADLRWLVIACLHCHTEVSIDAKQTETAIPSQCPSCLQTYDVTLRQNLDSYRKLYGSAQWKIRIAKTAIA